jgi:hypothetical protein
MISEDKIYFRIHLDKSGKNVLSGEEPLLLLLLWSCFFARA